MMQWSNYGLIAAGQCRGSVCNVAVSFQMLRSMYDELRST